MGRTFGMQALLLILLVLSAPGCKGKKKAGAGDPESSGIVEAIRSLRSPDHRKQELYDAGEGNIHGIGFSADGSRWFVSASKPGLDAGDPGLLITGDGELSDRVLVVGDTETDIRAGKAAGAKTAGYVTEYRSADMLKKENPDRIIEGIEEVGSQMLNELFLP